jgi:hypothetical protein
MIHFSKHLARMALLLFCSLGFSSLAVAQSGGEEGESTSEIKAKADNRTDKLAKKADESANPTLANLAGAASGFRLQATVTHQPKLRNDQEDTTDILLRGDYNLNKRHTLRVQQFFTKFYGKYESEYEFKPFDTTFAHFYRMPWRPGGVGLQWRNQVSLPISNESVRDDLITTFQTSVVGSKAFLGGKLLAFGIPYSRYFFYQYKTGEERLLPRWQNGLSLGALYFFTPKLAFYAGGDYRIDTVYNSPFDQTPNQVPQGTYRFDLDLSYQFTNNLTASVSYAQGRASYIQNGRYELVLFDDQASRVNFGMTYIY